MLILSFSGQGENSLTLKSLEVLEHHSEVEKFEKCIVKPTFNFEKDFDDVLKKMQDADAIIWAVSPFHMNIPSHLIQFFEECRKRRVWLNNVNTYFTTNMRVCDTFLTAALERQIRAIAGIFVQGLSFATPDIINQKMSLYNIATPDPPPKKKLFGGNPAPFSEGEGLKTAVQWYNILKRITLITKSGSQSLSFRAGERARHVLFIDMQEQPETISPFVKGCIENLKSFYKSSECIVEDLAQRDFKIKPCDGCKICYASKECKFKDDFLKYEERIRTADIIIYYGSCVGGFTSSLSKVFIDRGVKNGLMPYGGVLPSEMEKYQAVGYVLDTDPESYAVFKEYAFAMASFSFQHFLGVCANIPFQSQNDLETMKYYSMFVIREKMIPQRNFYSEKIGKHFSDLSQNIPMVIPEEAKYYKRAGGYEPIPLDHNARTVMPDTYKIGLQMRQIPYNKAIEALDKMNNKE